MTDSTLDLTLKSKGCPDGRLSRAIYRIDGRTDYNSPVDVDIVGFSCRVAEASTFTNMVSDIIQVAESGANFSDPTAAGELSYIYKNLMCEQHLLIDTNPGSAIDEDMNRLRVPLDYLNWDCNTRIDQDFIGAHSNIGGGYNQNNQSVAQNGDLSDVSLQWMVNQA
ncbi:MAG: DUF2235 domain-containing protein, partial [Candidatus Thiodiazotropha sp.]